MMALWQHALNFGLGILLRLWNEHQKQKSADHKMELALVSKKMEILDAQYEKVNNNTFLQFMMMMMVFVSMGVLVLFPLISAFSEIPLFLLHEYVKETGFWIFKSTQAVSEWVQITGLYLPHEFQLVMISAIEFIFGAVIGGLGRR